MMLRTALQQDGANAKKPNAAAAEKEQATLFKKITETLDADLFLFSGPTERLSAEALVRTVERNRQRDNVALILCTYGGDADAAYIIARFLKSTYKRFTLYIFGFCKSAGTLIALGSDEIVMSCRGELGPLDVQIIKADELLFRSSGLDIEQAIDSLSEQAFETFEKHFLEIIRRGGGAITTKTAADIASSLAMGLFSPITAQIDPLRVGEVQRAIDIAFRYGIRLNKDEELVNKLISDYPSHSFVIDYREAEEIFGNVRVPDETESRLERALLQHEEAGQKCISQPNRDGLIAYLSPRKEQANENETPHRGPDRAEEHERNNRDNSEEARTDPPRVQSATEA